jgi:hypothetical protein
MKAGTPISTMNLPLIPSDEMERRMQYAADRLRNAGLLVHSGGQKIETLLKNYADKEALRR